MPVYKDKKRNTWYFRTKYKDVYGNYKECKRRGFATKKEAKEAENLFVTSQKETNLQMTLDELYNEYILYSKDRLKQSTINLTEFIYNKYIKPAFGNKKIKDITTKDILRLQNDIKNSNHKVTYINGITSELAKIFSYADKFYDTNYNPVKKVGKIKKQDTDIETFNVWNLDEFNKVISVIDNLEHKTLITLLYFSGIRRGECLALTWDDYNGSSIKINKTCSSVKGGYVITKPKTSNSNRTVSLSDKTVELLNELYNNKKDYDGFCDDHYIFGDVHPRSISFISKTMKKYEEIANVKHIRVHDLRHSHVSLLINNNIPVPAIADRVGDTIDTVLKTYAHLFEESNDKLLDFLNNLEK